MALAPAGSPAVKIWPHAEQRSFVGIDVELEVRAAHAHGIDDIARARRFFDDLFHLSCQRMQVFQVATDDPNRDGCRDRRSVLKLLHIYARIRILAQLSA